MALTSLIRRNPDVFIVRPTLRTHKSTKKRDETGDKEFEALVELLTERELEPVKDGPTTRHSEAAGGWEIDEGHVWPTIQFFVGSGVLTEAEGKKLYKIGWRNKPLSK